MNSYTIKLNSAQAEKIKQILKDENATFDAIQYSVWRAKTANYQAVYYASGKLLLQGKDVTNIVNKINFTLGMNECTESNVCETKISADVYIGTDESGKGDFFGPLVIAGVQVNEQNKQKFIDLGIKDSKKLDDKKILQFSNIIKANSIHSTVVITPTKYNELYSKFKNLNKLLAWGHARAIENILEKSPCECALADKFGDESLIKNALMQKGQNITLHQMVRAEADIAVACASVLARAEFVKRMNSMQEKFEMVFSKGASTQVKEQAKNFISQYSFNRLNEVAKMHFKTATELN